MKSPSSFPSRLFRWFLSNQIIQSGIFFLTLTVALWFWVGERETSAEAIYASREMVLICLFSAFLATTVISVFMARRLLIPLGRLIDKTRSLREFPFESSEEPLEELTFDEPGEWFELERALNRLGRDLRQKTIRLSREKTELR